MQKKDAKSCVFIPALVRAEQEDNEMNKNTMIYTRPCKGGTLSVYAVFSHLKYFVVQFAQKPFAVLVTYLICRKISFVDKKIVKNIKKII